MSKVNRIEYKKSEWVDFKDLKGKRLGGFKKAEHDGNDALLFADLDGNVYMMTHHQDCCESVWLEDVCGSWDDIEWEEVLEALETTEDMPDAGESGTYSFYTFKTFKGSVTLRWCGTSNGYYSETVNLNKIIF